MSLRRLNLTAGHAGGRCVVFPLRVVHIDVAARPRNDGFHLIFLSWLLTLEADPWSDVFQGPLLVGGESEPRLDLSVPPWRSSPCSSCFVAELGLLAVSGIKLLGLWGVVASLHYAFHDECAEYAGE